MTSIKERFEAFFTPERFLRLYQKTKAHEARKEVLAFFHQELLALAEEVEETERDIQNKNVIGFNVAIDKVATLIRAKAAELQ